MRGIRIFYSDAAIFSIQKYINSSNITSSAALRMLFMALTQAIWSWALSCSVTPCSVACRSISCEMSIEFA